MRVVSALFAACSLIATAGRAAAWGELGHRVTGLIAYRHLTPAARARVDAIMAADTDPLTPRDFAGRTNWADKYRSAHRETAAWHFADIEIDHPDLKAACYGFAPLAPGQLASQGPAQACVVAKIEQFTAELRSPSTSPNERLLALKFLIHFVGDLHQPLHAADHMDKGGNCIGLDPAPDGHAANLHAYWDTGAVGSLGGSAEAIAAELDDRTSPERVGTWSAGDPRAWAMETFKIAQRDAYALPTRPTCSDHGAKALTETYQAMAKRDVALQLEKAGVRMAALLNRALH
ncbi:S1/P1 nuclease [Phenylobacterium montanum]|uniref:S1/P1 nuclease n=1 Tax=Phenylobacterium montanum TaxID=2823693 RepID=A0A975IWW3_9CAUL|nr:S1/P1 nuclease [Caulobacter sp. S6]QUD90318.1 S1/P1 nuclease [Caulobacter sp. S6]